MSARMRTASFLTAAAALTTPLAHAQLAQDTNALSCTAIKAVDGTPLAFGQVAPGSVIQHQSDGSCYDMGVPPPPPVVLVPQPIVVAPPPPVVGVGVIVGVPGAVVVGPGVVIEERGRYIEPERRPIYRGHCDRHDRC